jgi:hypothetical protein
MGRLAGNLKNGRDYVTGMHPVQYRMRNIQALPINLLRKINLYILVAHSWMRKPRL